MDDRPVPVVHGVVLTGGASRRMGRDKAFVEVADRPMVQRVAAALTDGGCRVVTCLGGDVERLGDLGLVATPDRSAGAGPAAAIVDVVERTDWSVVDAVVVAACDLALLDGDTVDAIVEQVAVEPGRVAVATADARRHLLLAVPRAAAAAVRRAGADGAAVGVSLRRFLAGTGAGVVDVEVASAAVRNLNAPTDLDGTLGR